MLTPASPLSTQVDPLADARNRKACLSLQSARDTMANISRLSKLNVDEAARAFVEYEHLLSELQLRMDPGQHLPVLFEWHDAWKGKQHRLEKPNPEWERACVLFNAASACAYSGSLAQESGDMKAAAQAFQNAAGCLEASHALVKPNIMGLTPRWQADELTPDMTLDVLVALKVLMLGQAQRATFLKAKAEGLSDANVAKLAAQASNLIHDARKGLDTDQMREHIATERGSFMRKSVNYEWNTTLRCLEDHLRSQAQELQSRAAEKECAYGEQVARLHSAVELCYRAVQCAEKEKLGCSSGCTMLNTRYETLRHQLAEAEHANNTTYFEAVPPASTLAKIEPKLLVQPLRLEPRGAEGARSEVIFTGLLPGHIQEAVQKYEQSSTALVHEVNMKSARGASLVQSRLQNLGLPHALEACERDKRLPTGLEKEITDAKAKTGPKGAMHLLSKMFAECDDLSEETSMMFKVASEMLTSQDEADAMLLSEEPRVQLENLNTTATLTRLRKDIDSLKERMDKAEQVTRELRIRFHEAAPELGMIDKPLKDLESKMPHLDGTPLEVEPCVPALYALFEQLDELKAESAAAIAAAKALRDAACSADSLDTLGEELHRLSLSSSEVSLDAVVDERMEGFKAVSSDCDERQEKRVKLLKQVEEQHAIFKTAKCAATEFYERREYLGRVRKGATTAAELVTGLEEGKGFYKTLLKHARELVQRLAALSEQRQAEGAVVRRNIANPPPPPPPPPPRQAHTYYPGAPAMQPVPVAQHVPTAHHMPTAQHVPPIPQPASSINKIACHGCYKQFGVPPNVRVVACPFCGKHNRVPGL